MKAKQKIVRFIIYAIAILCLLAWLFPFFWILRTAFMEYKQILAYPPAWFPSPFVFSNFTEGLKAFDFVRYYLNTALIVSVCLAGTVFTSTLCAYAFSRLRWPGRDRVFYIILTSMMLPPAVTLIPTFIGWTAVHGVNTYLPLTVPSWLGGGAFSIFLLRQFYMTIPREYDEAAVVDGAGYFTIYRKIMLPMIKPALISVGMFCFVNNWNDFMNPLVYLSDERKYTISLGLRSFMGMYNTEWGYMMAVTVVAVLPVLVVFLIGQKYIVEGVVMTGVKG